MSVTFLQQWGLTLAQELFNSVVGTYCCTIVLWDLNVTLAWVHICKLMTKNAIMASSH